MANVTIEIKTPSEISRDLSVVNEVIALQAWTKYVSLPTGKFLPRAGRKIQDLRHLGGVPDEIFGLLLSLSNPLVLLDMIRSYHDEPKVYGGTLREDSESDLLGTDSCLLLLDAITGFFQARRYLTPSNIKQVSQFFIDVVHSLSKEITRLPQTIIRILERSFVTRTFKSNTEVAIAKRWRYLITSCRTSVKLRLEILSAFSATLVASVLPFWKIYAEKPLAELEAKVCSEEFTLSDVLPSGLLRSHAQPSTPTASTPNSRYSKFACLSPRSTTDVFLSPREAAAARQSFELQRTQTAVENAVGGHRLAKSSFLYALSLMMIAGIRCSLDCSMVIEKLRRRLIRAAASCSAKTQAERLTSRWLEEDTLDSEPLNYFSTSMLGSSPPVCTVRTFSLPRIPLLPKLMAGFTEVYPEMFSWVRYSSGILPHDFKRALCDSQRPLIEFASNSQSGNFFLFSGDGQYLIKTVSKSEAYRLIKFLPSYVRHLQLNITSFLCRIYGLYRLEISTSQGEGSRLSSDFGNSVSPTIRSASFQRASNGTASFPFLAEKSNAVISGSHAGGHLHSRVSQKLSDRRKPPGDPKPMSSYSSHNGSGFRGFQSLQSKIHSPEKQQHPTMKAGFSAASDYFSTPNLNSLNSRGMPIDPSTRPVVMTMPERIKEADDTTTMASEMNSAEYAKNRAEQATWELSGTTEAATPLAQTISPNDEALSDLSAVRRIIYFTILGTVFDAKAGVDEMFDLKGSTVSRTASPDDPVKKDMDWRRQRRRLKLSPQMRDAFLEAHKADCEFLTRHGIFDYSLLIGVRHIPPAEREALLKRQESRWETAITGEPEAVNTTGIGWLPKKTMVVDQNDPRLETDRTRAASNISSPDVTELLLTRRPPAVVLSAEAREQIRSKWRIAGIAVTFLIRYTNSKAVNRSCISDKFSHQNYITKQWLSVAFETGSGRSLSELYRHQEESNSSSIDILDDQVDASQDCGTKAFVAESLVTRMPSTASSGGGGGDVLGHHEQTNSTDLQWSGESFNLDDAIFCPRVDLATTESAGFGTESGSFGTESGCGGAPRRTSISMQASGQHCSFSTDEESLLTIARDDRCCCLTGSRSASPFDADRRLHTKNLPLARRQLYSNREKGDEERQSKHHLPRRKSPFTLMSLQGCCGAPSNSYFREDHRSRGNQSENGGGSSPLLRCDESQDLCCSTTGKSTARLRLSHVVPPTLAQSPGLHHKHHQQQLHAQATALERISPKSFPHPYTFYAKKRRDDALSPKCWLPTKRQRNLLHETSTTERRLTLLCSEGSSAPQDCAPPQSQLLNSSAAESFAVDSGYGGSAECSEFPPSSLAETCLIAQIPVTSLQIRAESLKLKISGSRSPREEALAYAVTLNSSSREALIQRQISAEAATLITTRSNVLPSLSIDSLSSPLAAAAAAVTNSSSRTSHSKKLTDRQLLLAHSRSIETIRSNTSNSIASQTLTQSGSPSGDPPEPIKLWPTDGSTEQQRAVVFHLSRSQEKLSLKQSEDYIGDDVVSAANSTGSSSSSTSIPLIPSPRASMNSNAGGKRVSLVVPPLRQVVASTGEATTAAASVSDNSSTKIIGGKKRRNLLAGSSLSQNGGVFSPNVKSAVTRFPGSPSDQYRILSEDGSEMYYIAIIDFITPYTLRRYLHTIWKYTKSGGPFAGAISPVPPIYYGRRQVEFVKDFVVPTDNGPRRAVSFRPRRRSTMGRFDPLLRDRKSDIERAPHSEANSF